MKKWEELTSSQQNRITEFFVYILSDQFIIDMLKDIPDTCYNDLQTHGYDPDEMTLEEKVEALKIIIEQETDDDIYR